MQTNAMSGEWEEEEKKDTSTDSIWESEKKTIEGDEIFSFFLICATVKGPLPIVLYFTCVCNIMKGEEGGKKDARFLYLLKFVWEMWGTTGGAMQLLLLLYSTWSGLYSIAHLSVARRRRRRFFSFFLFGIIQMLHW